MSPEPAKEPQPVKPEPESPDLEDKAANKRRKVCVKMSDESGDADHENLTMLVEATEEAARKKLIFSSDPNIMTTVESRARLVARLVAPDPSAAKPVAVPALGAGSTAPPAAFSDAGQALGAGSTALGAGSPDKASPTI